MLSFLIDNYELFAVPLALGFFWISEWFYDEWDEIIRSLSSYPRFPVSLLVFAGSVAAYWCAYGILDAGDRTVANAFLCGFLGFAFHKRFFNTND